MSAKDRPDKRSPSEQARLAREAAALRENLRKRKDQARGRAHAQDQSPGSVPKSAKKD